MNILFQISYERKSQTRHEKEMSGDMVSIETLSCCDATNAENRKMLHDMLDEYLDKNTVWDIPADSDIGFRVMGACKSHIHNKEN